MKIDVHVHIAGKDGPGGCFMSPEMQSSFPYYVMLATTGHLFDKVDEETIRRHLLQTLDESEEVDKAVLLALDMVHEPDGTPRPDRTNLYSPNDYVADVASHEKVLFGASVHPYRTDVLEELQRVADAGAALVKWLPSAQDIDPASDRCAPAYGKLAELGLPLLCHVGAEHAIPDAKGERQGGYGQLNHPLRLIPALKAGVKVIAAHCCTPVYWSDPDWTPEFISLMNTAVSEGWSLYADVSALAMLLPARMALLDEVVTQLPHDRLLLGSDYPIPVGVPLPGTGAVMSVAEWVTATGIMNPFDRNVAVVKALGFAPEVLTNAEQVLRLN